MTTIRLTRNIGLLLAGVWLLVYGVLLTFPGVQFTNWNIVLGLLAFVTGVLIVVDYDQK